MPLWDKVRQELDRAGRVAAEALDEGRLRLEATRVRRLADRAAQQLGYAVYRARRDGQPLGDETIARYAATLAAHEAEADRLEAQIAAVRQRSAPGGAASGAAGAGAGASASTPGDRPAGAETGTGTDDAGAFV